MGGPAAEGVPLRPSSPRIEAAAPLCVPPTSPALTPEPPRPLPSPQVRPIAEDEMFRVMKTGKRMKKSWKRVITKATFVGEGFTRKPPKYERFIRPTGLRFTKANVTHPDLRTTFQLDIIGVKKNPNGQMYTQLGVLTKGTIVEVR